MCVALHHHHHAHTPHHKPPPHTPHHALHTRQNTTLITPHVPQHTLEPGHGVFIIATTVYQMQLQLSFYCHVPSHWQAFQWCYILALFLSIFLSVSIYLSLCFSLSFSLFLSLSRLNVQSNWVLKNYCFYGNFIFCIFFLNAHCGLRIYVYIKWWSVYKWQGSKDILVFRICSIDTFVRHLNLGIPIIYPHWVQMTPGSLAANNCRAFSYWSNYCI